MEALKKQIEQRKLAQKEAFKEKKWLKRSELEQAMAVSQAPPESSAPPEKKQRTDERPATSRRARGGAASQPASTLSSQLSLQAEALKDVPREEIMRRLRRLKQPATLFGERHLDRCKRLVTVEGEIAVEDHTGGAETTNVLLDIRREEREAAARLAAAPAAAAAGTAAGASAARGGPASTSTGGAADGTSEGAADEDEDPLMAAFREAAERLKEERRIKEMKLEDKIMHYLKIYMAEWKADLDARSEEAKLTSVGKVAADAYKMTENAFKGLYARLRSPQGVHQQLVLGIWMMIEGIQQRNYIHANEIYSRVAIGNACWPIGVTSVGIHERSAREKISSYANVTSQAHIMNDEATRKFLQGMKRLMSAMQRLHPTDPSRSVDFNAMQHEGLGAKAGAEKQLLLTSEAHGDTWRAQGLPAAPHYLSKNSRAVAVPQTWGNTLRAVEAELAKKD